MSRLIAVTAPILPGKEQVWRNFVDDVRNKYYDEFIKSRKKLNVRERTFHQVTPQGEFVVVTLEGDNPEQALKDLAKGNDDFTVWFNQKVLEIHNINIAALPPEALPELVVDSIKERVNV